MKVEILLVIFFVGFGIYCDAFSSSVDVEESGGDSAVSNSLNINSSEFKKYFVEPYFEKYESFVEANFQDFTARELLGYSCKLHSKDPSDLYRVSVLNRHLTGEGSHRQLRSSFKFHFQSELISQLPHGENATICKFIILEKLISGLFADPFELQHLLERGAFADVAVFGDTNLELPSFASNRSVVEVHLSVNSSVLFGLKKELELSIDLPLHARYQPLGEVGYSEIKFGEPDILMHCNLRDETCLFAPILVHEGSNGTVLWKIPSGIRTHAATVATFTFSTAFEATLIITIATIAFVAG